MLLDEQPSSDPAPEYISIATPDSAPLGTSEIHQTPSANAHNMLEPGTPRVQTAPLLQQTDNTDAQSIASNSSISYVSVMSHSMDADKTDAMDITEPSRNDRSLDPGEFIPAPLFGSPSVVAQATPQLRGQIPFTAQIELLTSPLPNQKTHSPAKQVQQATLIRKDPLDLVNRIPNLFRMLDLMSEDGSNGLVNKIIIAQDSLGDFVNAILPHSYRSVTKIDFLKLDTVRIKPLGIYGSKEEIIRLLISLGIVDQEIVRLLTLPNDQMHKDPSLRSGIYALIPRHGSSSPSTGEYRVYIIYWPEETTWNDDADSSVRKNRVAFMRYLTQLTDQVRALISEEHGRKLIWKEAGMIEDLDVNEIPMFDLDASDRIFDFEVAKTKDEDENALARPGFRVELPPNSEERSTSRSTCWSLIRGEIKQGLLVRRDMPVDSQLVAYDEVLNPARLKSELHNVGAISLPDDITREALEFLLDDGGIKSRIPSFKPFLDASARLKSLSFERVRRDTKDSRQKIKAAIREALIRTLDQAYPSLNIANISDLYPKEERSLFISRESAADYLGRLVSTYPELDALLQEVCQGITKNIAWTSRYLTARERFLQVRREFRSGKSISQADRKAMIDAIFSFNNIPAMASQNSSRPRSYAGATIGRLVYRGFSLLTTSILGASNDDVEEHGDRGEQEDVNHADFIAGLRAIATRDPSLLEPITGLIKAACESMRITIQKGVKDLFPKLDDTFTQLVSSKAEHVLEEESRELFNAFRTEVKSLLSKPISSRPSLELHHVTKLPGRRGLEIVGGRTFIVEAHTRYECRGLEISESDKDKLREDPTFVPTPRPSRQPDDFRTDPTGWNIRSAQYVGRDRILWIVDRIDGVHIWLAPSRVGIPSTAPQRKLRRPDDGHLVFATDEQQSLLAVIALGKNRISVNMYTLDPTSNTIQGRGSPVELRQWYPDGMPEIISACFFSGTQELCLVEENGKIRAFSLVTLSFRPSRLDLKQTPLHVQSSPDGSALLVVEPCLSSPDRRQLRVFHSTSLGTTNGIVHALPPEFSGASEYAVTSIERQGTCYLLALLPQLNAVQSIAIVISRKETEYSFRAERSLTASTAPQGTQHNSLLQCFEEVWDRYPVAAAIARETLSDQGRQDQSLEFLCDVEGYPFQGYFKRMARTFAQVSKKPTGQKLENIELSTSTMASADWTMFTTSSFAAGEWLTELLCLIPIHIAVARDNRFLPLKDGVLNAQLEQRLLGAEISDIIDSISLGWYESIFSSYMASKPVKVISSMGEQSVGKSYSLNHIVDASFAGSAVRTTEGVWLSVTPTRDLLIVALDFEGVHSIERSPQEDMLLVLFNTALSNLVLFRNNFALSRDVAHMFTSFQASTHSLNPAANPTLFKGELAIVIKDVVESDKKEIVKEFSDKFRQIVIQEQGANFISVLHNGKVMVIPWSVIQSTEFYALFSSLSRRLLREPSTHGSAGEFLLTLKTLMAKLKAQDWGSVDDTVIKHRVATLQAILPRALFCGKSEVELAVDSELRNLDNQEIIPHEDGDALFYLEAEPAKQQAALLRLMLTWHDEPARQPLEDLRHFLNNSAQARLLHVREWLNQNTARFSAENGDLRSLFRSFDGIRDCLLGNLRVCGASCRSCQLPCILRKPDGPHAHDCLTNHQCLSICDYGDEHTSAAACGLPAGHGGQHVCEGAAHLCGQLCDLSSKKGCQQFCSKSSNHADDGHQCSVKYHQCGASCDLQDVVTPLGAIWSCPKPCALPFDDLHDKHSCEDRLSCPIKCQLCQRYCALGDHFHGLTDNIHLCGDKHDCSHLCESAGICNVDTVPRSVESIFTGRHVTFQYTKYTQAAKRLLCAIEIKPGEISHEGCHIHTNTPDPVHFCDVQCPNCGYFCNFPLNHPQNEHETSHGSMENTAWAIEGDPDATVEIQGRKFGIQEGGAPQLCSLVCQELGRHAHLAFCRSGKEGACQEAETEHITTPMLPDVGRAKDWITHRLFWARSGFKDPYSQVTQTDFALCDAACAGPEHEPTATAQANPSFCTLPIFHPPQPIDWQGGNAAHVSADGHAFACPNPNNLRQAYHVIFVLDRSSSMGGNDIRPLEQQPVTQRIRARNDNRFGAVLSAFYGFCLSRGSGASGPRRDAYSVVLFDHAARTVISNDFTSSPEDLVNQLLNTSLDGGTHFDAALSETQSVMDTNWSNERSPIVIFLSDGECAVSDNVIYDLCNRAVVQGKALSLQTVSFGPARWSTSLRRMIAVAQDVAGRIPPDPMSPVIPSAYSDAIDNVRLAQTFLNIADSLKKPRASLMRSTRP